MENLNDNSYNDNCQKELFKLRRELKISKLLLHQKLKEIEEAKKTNEQLKSENQNFFDKVNQLLKEIKDYNEQNKILEKNNNLKKLEQEELVKKINEGKLIPLDNYIEENDEQINYDNFPIFQRDY